MANETLRLPTRDRCHELLEYNPNTGIALWKPRASGAKPGELKRWNSRYAGKVAAQRTRTHSGHIQISIDGKLYYLHRLIWMMMTGNEPADQIDHINGDPSDNRWDNLRPASHSENIRNRTMRSDNSSGRKGVYWNRSQKLWHAQIYAGRKIHLGFYQDLDAAAAAYAAGSARYHGDFARV